MDQEIEAPAAGRNKDVLVRTFAAELTPGDGRTADVRIVPYGERIVHNDGFGGVPKGVPYTEEWSPGAFAHQVKATGREREIKMKFGHNDDLRNVVGHGIVFREASDGFYGSFKFLEHDDGDKALLLVREGVISGISLEATAKSVRSKEGIIQRVKGHLRAIALTSTPAYTSARILALREEADEEIGFDEKLLPVEIDPEVAARIQRLGLALPVRTDPVVVRAKANPVVTLRQCVGMLRAYIAAEPDAADKREAEGVLATLEKLMVKDMQEGEAAA